MSVDVAIDYVEFDLDDVPASKMLEDLQPLIDEIKRRHSSEHVGPVWLCDDPVCREFSEVLA